MSLWDRLRPKKRRPVGEATAEGVPAPVAKAAKALNDACRVSGLPMIAVVQLDDRRAGTWCCIPPESSAGVVIDVAVSLGVLSEDDVVSREVARA